MGKFNHKEFKRAIARNAFYFFRAVFRILPYGAVKVITNAIISAGFLLVKEKRDIAKESLDIAFGSTMDDQQKNRVIKECFSNLGRGMIELLYYSDHPKMIKEKAFFENIHYLQDALKEGKGAILVSAHFGNFPLMLLHLVREGFPTSVILRPSRDQKIEKDFMQLRDKFGLKSIYSLPRTTCVARALRTLRNNELLFIPADQNFGTKGGVFVDFFGRKASTPTGPAVFAMRTGAPIVPIFTHRFEDDKHKIVVDKPFHIEIKDNDEDTVFACMEKITQIIETYIRKYPQEWGWMHRRWKTQQIDVQDSNE